MSLSPGLPFPTVCPVDPSWWLLCLFHEKVQSPLALGSVLHAGGRAGNRLMEPLPAVNSKLVLSSGKCGEGTFEEQSSTPD